MPQTNPVMQNGFLQQNFVRLDKDFQVMHKATKAQDLLIQSMTLMDQQVQQRVAVVEDEGGWQRVKEIMAGIDMRDF